jgi:hypothetical protein
MAISMPGQHDALAADAVGEPAEEHEERRHGHNGDHQQLVHLGAVDGAGLAHEREGVVLTRVPDHALPGSGPKQRQQYHFQVPLFGKTLLERVFRHLARRFELGEQRRLVHFHPDEHRNHDQKDGDQEGNAPTPVGKGFP